MRLSQKAEYALRAMLELSREHSKGRRTRSAEIAKRQGIPEKFLELILVELRRAGLLASTRGPVGGHRLSRDPSKISIGQIWRAIDGQSMVRGEVKVEDSFAFVWEMVDDAVSKIVDHVTLEDVRLRSESRQGIADFNI